MDWDDLRIFLAVARFDSLSQAGKRLGMEASTVGRRIARLEAALGRGLFAKTPQGYSLTSEGARLLPQAEAVEKAAVAANEFATNDESGLTGQIRIGAPDGCANYLLPQVCAAIGLLHPNLEIQVVALPRVVNLSKREADLAIAVSPPDTGRLVVQRLTDYRLHLAAHESYLAAHPAIRTRDDLSGHRIVGYIPDMIFDRELDYLTEIGVVAAQFSSNSVSVQMQAIRAGAGLGIVHDFALPFAPGVRCVLSEQISLSRSFWLIRHADDQSSQRLSRLAALLARGLRREVALLEDKAASADITRS